MPAAAASSSTKPSTAKLLAILPGARMFDGRSGVSFSQCTSDVCRRAIGRIAVLRQQAGRQPRLCQGRPRPAPISGTNGRPARRLRQPHVGCASATMRAFGVDRADKSSNCGGPFGSQPCSSSRIHCTRTGRPTARDSMRGIGRGIVVAVHAVAAGAIEVDHAHLVARQCRAIARTMPAKPVRRLRCGPDRRAVGLARRRRRTTARSTHGSGSARSTWP